IGAACQLPGDINNLHDLWQTLEQGKVHTCEAPLSRWDSDAIIAAHSHLVDPDRIDTMRYGGFLSDQAFLTFDASKYGISEAEAKQMDPAQRLLLDAAYDALMDAGYTMESLEGLKAGVFVAASGTLGETSGFPLAGFRVNSSLSSYHHSSGAKEGQVENIMDEKRHLSVYDVTSNTLSVAAGRISYTFGFQGPCTTTDTACSSSLVALHAARRALQHRECDLAVVVSVNLLHPASSLACSVAGMLSSDGRCNTFDESANGYCRGEGSGALVLKRSLDLDSREKEHVYAYVKGSAVRSRR
ncbi:polyketide synthase, partial [archaeon]